MSISKSVCGAVLAGLMFSSGSTANAVPAASRNQLFAHVNYNGAVIYEHGVAKITHPATGVYCILPTSGTLQEGVPTGIVAPTVTLDYGNTPDETVVVNYGGTNINYCPSPFYIVVYSYYVAPGVYTAKDAAFILSFN